MSRPTASRSISRPKSSASASHAFHPAPPQRSPSPPAPPSHTDDSLGLPSLTPTQARLLEKQQEHAGLQALKEASGTLLARVEEMAKMGHVMADGGEAVGSVLRNWPLVFSILNLFDQPAPPSKSADGTDASDSHGDGAGDDGADTEQKPLPHLVRLPFTESDV